MFSEEDQSNSRESELPEEILEFLEDRKEQRLKTVAVTQKVTATALSLTLNATGFFLARALLYLGGSTNLLLAVSLCFAFGSTSAFAKLENFSANYNGETGLDIQGGDKVITALSGFGTSALTTYLATKDFLHFEQASNQTIVQIEHDIDEIQQPSGWGDPLTWLASGLIILLILPRFLRRG